MDAAGLPEITLNAVFELERSFMGEGGNRATGGISLVAGADQQGRVATEDRFELLVSQVGRQIAWATHGTALYTLASSSAHTGT